jgi:hypothetical protein
LPQKNINMIKNYIPIVTFLPPLCRTSVRDRHTASYPSSFAAPGEGAHVTFMLSIPGPVIRAHDRNRTGIPLRVGDFKSPVSTNSTTRAKKIKVPAFPRHTRHPVCPPSLAISAWLRGLTISRQKRSYHLSSNFFSRCLLEKHRIIAP